MKHKKAIVVLGVWVGIFLVLLLCKELIELDKQNRRLKIKLTEQLQINAELRSKNNFLINEIKQCR